MTIINNFLRSSNKFLLALGCVLFANTGIAADKTLDSIAAIVNNDVIMISEVKAEAIKAKRSNKQNVSEQTLIKEAMEKLILDKIQVQRAKAVGIKIDDTAVDQAMQSLAEQNKLDLQKFRIALINEGYNYKDFRENIRDRLYMNTLRKRQQVSNKSISESEVDDLIQAESFSLNKGVQYRFIDIFIPNKNGQGVQQFNANYNRAQQLRKQLLGKSTIPKATLSKMGASSQELGWKESSTLSPVYMRSLSLIGEGELSQVVRDERGFHILKLIEQRGGKRTETKQARVRHILVSADTPNGRIKAIQIRNRILAGENFNKLAKENSADKGSAEKGGEMPMSNPAIFVPPFAKAVNSLPLNTLSQPVQTKFGWHIIEVLERKVSDQTRDALKKQAQTLISDKKQEEGFKNWLKSLRDQAFVEYRLNL
ncbi:peptidylprolyl isomerase [Cocleimonas sp. KMM 6892]|uniref:peptidylprolyl isomerase n=1 Tax=unclassified Cocleimonas TaxID=2639732 RepID=UPI002DBEB880|nr:MULTISPECIES: peptidylprolyl isomerase [unclassified Cocleimonas]MEB8431765.1 peptidylprolyl isomerase [Cocleimonas sp. KMM 6892]MEC4715149.1 peptidylprolyl isomerase [Cocleimonas sp. KMM 6895]MEC4744037.1 peptidylprolyl isomerase [Cocleimonas sp. KMM 6896]